ncbi:SigB/SigF/SigG family RNA polymerase sigma factor [Kitasatospora sp. NBC_00315]|uniref:SigB/SigF/SigG family RNA polymerase sigma factor n=1 Tax=Kitasatospora sp. NBC_00315 TaxID=2975963 RepID=UPI00324CA6D1
MTTSLNAAPTADPGTVEAGALRRAVPAPRRTAAGSRSTDGLEQLPSEVAPADARELSRALFARLRTLEEGTAEYSYTRATLVELNQVLVHFAARRFRAGREPMEDIVQVGTIGLIKAIDRFDPERGLEFSTFALPTITGEIKRFFRDTTWHVHVPRRLQELRLTIAKAADELEQRLDRAPGVADLAAHLGLPQEEIVEGLVASNSHTAGSLDASTEEGAESALAARLGFQDPGFELAENLHALRPLIAGLSERERAILSMRFVEELTQSQIGARLGLSQMHVSRLLTRTLAALRAALLAEE